MSLISKSGIVTGQTIQAEHVTRIIDALNESGSSSVIATGSFTGSFAGDGSQLTGISVATSSYALNSNLLDGYDSSVFATTASNTFNGTQIINGDVTITGTASIGVLHVTYESASVIYSSGSNQFGDSTTDTQTLIGTVIISGSLNVTGSANIPSITGSLFGTSSFAVSASSAQTAISASYASNSETASFSSTASFITASNVYGPNGASSVASASYAASASYVIGGVDPFPYTGSAEITGSLGVTGSVNVTRLGVGAIGSTSIPLDVRAQGALSTDIAFRVRNSTNTDNHFTVFGNDNIGIGGRATTGAILSVRGLNNTATTSLQVQNGYYGNNIFTVKDNATTSDSDIGSVLINARIYGGNSTGLGKEFDLGGYGLGSSYGDSSTNMVWLNNQGNLNDGAGTSVISVSSNFYINFQTNKRFLFKPSSANFGINQLTFGTNATNTLAIANGTAPDTSPTDAIQFYSNDITAGNAAPHFRTENGSIIKLYQQGPVSSSQGLADALTNLGLLSGSSAVIDATGSSAFPYTGSAIISGSLQVTGSVSVLGGVTASLFGTSSWAQNAVTASYIATASFATTALSASYAPSTFGAFGISNSSGSYTYYSTLSASMAAATSGQTVEMFADYTETGAVTISLKDGVNLNGNGHTYTCTYSSTSITLFENTTGTQNVSNLTIYGNGVHSSTNGFVITYTANKTFFDGVVIKMTAGVAAYVYGVSTIEGLICNVTGNARGFYVDSGNIIDCKSFSVNGYSIFTINNASVYDSYANSTSTSAFYLNTGAVYNCTGIGNIGIESQGGSMYNSIGLSNSGYGIYLQPAVTAAKVTNCTAISNASWGMFMYSNNALVVNCTIISTANNGIYSQFVSGCKLSNNYINSSAAIAVRLNAANASFNNNHIECTWNNSAGHAFQAGQSGDILCGNVFEVTNASANGLNAGSAITTKYIDSKFIGATIAVNSNITQATINTQDNYGNIII